MRQNLGCRRLRCVLATKHSSSRLEHTLTPVVNGLEAFSLSCLSKRLRAAWEERSSGLERGAAGFEVVAAGLSPDSLRLISSMIHHQCSNSFLKRRRFTSLTTICRWLSMLPARSIWSNPRRSTSSSYICSFVWLDDNTESRG